ncbi:hypothetical protein HA402_006680 [Bradysia odoriphaga]|nr:hypothetical protein HA402_006680 [Bradysia odoriphaga]
MDPLSCPVPTIIIDSPPEDNDTIDLPSINNIEKKSNGVSISDVNEIVSIADESSETESDDDVPKYRSYLRTKRRLSVSPLAVLRLHNTRKEMIANEFDRSGGVSNQNSITSVNSVASLLKEKIQTFPSMMRRKKKVTSDFKIKTFITILFLIIVFLVGYAYVMYHQKVLTRLYFDTVKFGKSDRSMHIYNQRGQEVFKGMLGRNINEVQPFRCLNENLRNDGSICFEWDKNARLYFNYEVKDGIECHDIKWEALSQDVFPKDCYDLPANKGNWYGGGITKANEFPIDRASFDMSPFITGDSYSQQFGNAVKRYFIGAEGVAIKISDDVPLHISMNRNNSRQFCMKAMHDQFAFVNRLTPNGMPFLKYKICLGKDMRSLHQFLTQQSLFDGMKQGELSIVHSIMEEPVWQISANGVANLNTMSIYNFTEQVVNSGFLRIGHVLINEFWQNEIGDYKVDEERFKDLREKVDILHRRGFKVVFTIQPFISTDSPNFAEAVQKKFLIYERLSERSIPALTRYKSSVSAGVLDVTNNNAVPWLLEKLKKIIVDYKIDSFFIDFGTAYNMPHYYQCNKSLVNPDYYKSIFTSSIEDHVPIFGVSGAISFPRPPAFLSLPPVNSSWEGLQSVIPAVISYGVIGFPFILSGPVGGDYSLPQNYQKIPSYQSLAQPPLPDKELFIRWFQLATFLPAMRFSHLPSEYKNDLMTEVAKELFGIRQKTVIPILKKYLSESMNQGLPLVRPLWMLESHDAACLNVYDEFSVGEELIVAPIVQKGQTVREVYLPQGVWKDGVDGSLRKGSRWIHNYRVPENKVAYFVKMPDNTRF